MKRFLLMTGVLVALLVSCEKSESDTEVVPSTPEELLEFCQGNWVTVSYVDYNGDFDQLELGWRFAWIFGNEGLQDALTDEKETCLIDPSEVHPLVSNDGKELIYEGISQPVGRCTAVCRYSGKNQLTIEMYSKNIDTSGPFGGLYQRDICERTGLKLKVE